MACQGYEQIVGSMQLQCTVQIQIPSSPVQTAVPMPANSNGSLLMITSCAVNECRYNWSYVETKNGVNTGDRVWQLAFGSSFKVASAVWTALKPINTQHDAWTETPSY